MEGDAHSDVLVCASEYIPDRLYFVTLKSAVRKLKDNLIDCPFLELDWCTKCHVIH